MTSVFDESVPRDFLPILREAGCDVVAFPNDWKGTKNGKLMQLVETAGFDCLVTCDKNLPYQQNLTQRSFAVVVLPSTRLVQLHELAERVADTVAKAPRGQATLVSS